MYKDNSKSAALVEAALGILDRDYVFLEGVEALAARLGVTKHHLIRCFSARTGTSPGRYLQRRRLEAAAALLRGRDYPVETVAVMTGFSCGNYFSKVFGRTFGRSPSVYRQEESGPLGPVEEKRVQELEYMYQT